MHYVWIMSLYKWENRYSRVRLRWSRLHWHLTYHKRQTRDSVVQKPTSARHFNRWVAHQGQDQTTFQLASSCCQVVQRNLCTGHPQHNYWFCVWHWPLIWSTGSHRTGQVMSPGLSRGLPLSSSGRGRPWEPPTEGRVHWQCGASGPAGRGY